MVYLIESLGQIDSAQIHSRLGYYMAVDKFADNINGVATANPFLKTKLVLFGYIKQS